MDERVYYISKHAIREKNDDKYCKQGIFTG